MSRLPVVSRRRFLRWTTFSAGMLALSRLRLQSAFAADAPPVALRVLTAPDAAIMTAIGERICDTGDPAMPAFRDTGALATIDTALLQLDDDTRSQFRWALLLVEYGPLIFDFSPHRFSGLDAESRDAHLRHWSDSSLGVRRQVFHAMKNLAFLGYYSQDATWAGIHYSGPWAPRPRRVVPA